MTLESVLLDMAIKGSLILALTGAVAAVMRKASAAARHLVWSTGTIAVVTLPALSALLPGWALPVMPPESAPALVDARVGEPAAGGPVVWWVGLWAAGTALVLGIFLLGRARVMWLARDAVPLERGHWPALATRLAGEMDVTRPVRLLQSRRSVMPMMWGLVRPTILLPREADGWSEGLKRDVLRHELAHVGRHDYPSQMIARLACALHWFDPLAWFAARRLRIERERACDDRVMRAGSSPCDYASHLLDVARWRATGAIGVPALQMAGGSALADRMKAVLETDRPRNGVSRGAAIAHGALAALLVVPLAIAHPEAAPQTPPVAEDPGGILPLPPSAVAGLSPPAPAGRIERARPDNPLAAASEPVEPGEAEPASVTPSRPAPEAKPAAASRVLNLDLQSSGRTVVRLAARDVRLLGRVVPVKVVAPPTCEESKGGRTLDGAPPVTDRTHLVSIPQSIATP